MHIQAVIYTALLLAVDEDITMQWALTESSVIPPFEMAKYRFKIFTKQNSLLWTDHLLAAWIIQLIVMRNAISIICDYYEYLYTYEFLINGTVNDLVYSWNIKINGSVIEKLLIDINVCLSKNNMKVKKCFKCKLINGKFLVDIFLLFKYLSNVLKSLFLFKTHL